MFRLPWKNLVHEPDIRVKTPEKSEICSKLAIKTPKDTRTRSVTSFWCLPC